MGTCDKCKYYNWYFDRCDKWQCTVNAKSMNSCFKPQESEDK